MKLELSTIINRSPAVVFDFFAVNHLTNHPRWDPHMELTKLTDGPMGVGTRFHRRQTRGDMVIEGTMDIVEFLPGRVLGGEILDQTPHGPQEIHSRATVDPVDGGRAKLTFHLDLPGVESLDPSMIEGSLRRIKELIETET
ncbi:SRPBCC family protein [Sinomonas mesophila]|uniref:SRPBCC family protein n=1 Tax=Sinomonas mesophila TaxID=1531955 RepID=UPI00098731B0|nr:SRPBCC family protein [Sinomonas mesophila]